MKKIVFMLFICSLTVACSNVKKPPLSPTQVVNGKSIIIPPEFDTRPEEPVEEKEK